MVGGHGMELSSVPLRQRTHLAQMSASPPRLTRPRSLACAACAPRKYLWMVGRRSAHQASWLEQRRSKQTTLRFNSGEVHAQALHYRTVEDGRCLDRHGDDPDD